MPEMRLEKNLLDAALGTSVKTDDSQVTSPSVPRYLGGATRESKTISAN